MFGDDLILVLKRVKIIAVMYINGPRAKERKKERKKQNNPMWNNKVWTTTAAAAEV